MSRTRDPDDMTERELDIGESDLGIDPDGFLDEEAIAIEGEEQADERVERESLQREDPADDDLPDQAFDRIVPGV